jgi:hypothetical protein
MKTHNKISHVSAKNNNKEVEVVIKTDLSKISEVLNENIDLSTIKSASFSKHSVKLKF